MLRCSLELFIDKYMDQSLHLTSNKATSVSHTHRHKVLKQKNLKNQPVLQTKRIPSV